MSHCADWQNKLDAYVDAELSPQEMEAFRVNSLA